MENLALTTGFRCEPDDLVSGKRKDAELAPFFDGVEQEGILLRLEIDEEGLPLLPWKRKGKR